MISVPSVAKSEKDGRWQYSLDHQRRNGCTVNGGCDEWQAGLLNGIGGKIEDGEAPIEALVREFAEETGVQTSAEEWSAIVHYVHPHSYEVFFTKRFQINCMMQSHGKQNESCDIV